MRRYRVWGGSPKGTPEDTACCIVEVPDGDRSPLSHQCQRRRKTGPGGAYCTQHAKDLAAGRYVRVPGEEGKMTREGLKLTLVDVSWHRNGVGGAGFYAVIFDDAEQGRMVASLFDEPGHCAVYKLGELVRTNIAFAQGNSWRGDQYEAALRPIIQAYLKTRGTNRMGPFAVPQAPRTGD